MRKMVKLPSVQNDNPGATATLELPVGLTYEHIVFKFVGNTDSGNTGTDMGPSHLKKIALKINGKTVQSYRDGVRLDKINQYYQRGAAQTCDADAVTYGYLPLFFLRPELDLPGEQRITVLGTSDVQTVSIEMEVDNALDHCTIEAYAIQTEAETLGTLCKVKEFPLTFATSGEQEISNLPHGDARIAAIHLFKSDVNEAEVIANSVKVVDGTKELMAFQAGEYSRSMQTSVCTTIDWTLAGLIGHSLATKGLQDLRILPTLGSSGQMDVVVEYLDGFDGL